MRHSYRVLPSLPNAPTILRIPPPGRRYDIVPKLRTFPLRKTISFSCGAVNALFLSHSTQLTQILAGLAQAEGIDWSSTKIYFADERCVPLDHSDRYVPVVHHSSQSCVESWPNEPLRFSVRDEMALYQPHCRRYMVSLRVDPPLNFHRKTCPLCGQRLTI